MENLKKENEALKKENEALKSYIETLKIDRATLIAQLRRREQRIYNLRLRNTYLQFQVDNL